MELANLLAIVEKNALQEITECGLYNLSCTTNCEEICFHSLHDYTAIIVDTSIVSDEFLYHLLILEHKPPTLVIPDQANLSLLLRLFAQNIFGFLTKPVKLNKVKELVKSIQGLTEYPFEMKVQSATPSWIEFDVPARGEYICIASSLVTILVIEKLCEKETNRLVFAFRELMQNAVEHGCQFSPSKRVFVQFLVGEKFIYFQVRDEGNGFDREAIPHAVLGNPKPALEVMKYRKETGMRPGGLGLSYITEIADEILYNEAGNSVVVMRYLASKENPSPEEPA